MTAIAVVFILGLGVAAVILIPGLLNGSPSSTPRSFAIPSRSPTAGASSVAVLPTPTQAAPATPTAEPTVAPTPEPTPRFYKIKAGDTLAKIARKFHLTVDDILAANPEVPDANHIEVGQYIIIPIALAT
jgi:LysM repeat protein